MEMKRQERRLPSEAAMRSSTARRYPAKKSDAECDHEITSACLSPKQRDLSCSERLEAVKSLRSGAGLARREVLERWRGNKAQGLKGCFVARTSAGGRGSGARDAQIPGAQSGRLSTKGCCPGRLALTRPLRRAGPEFQKADRRRCAGAAPQRRIDAPGPRLPPRPSTHAIVSTFCASSSNRTSPVVASWSCFPGKQRLAQEA